MIFGAAGRPSGRGMAIVSCIDVPGTRRCCCETAPGLESHIHIVGVFVAGSNGRDEVGGGNREGVAGMVHPLETSCLGEIVEWWCA